MGLGDAKLMLKYSVTGSTVSRACKMALVVGPVLTLINHAHTIVALEFGLRFFLQTALTFCVPYLVSTVSSAMTELAHAQALARGAPIGAEAGTGGAPAGGAGRGPAQDEAHP